MKRPWEAEFEVTSAMAGELIEGQFPELAPVTLEMFGEGWDNKAYLANGNFVFRFPRRAPGAVCMAGELQVLPHIHDRLPLPVSAPRYFGHSTDRYPWAFAGYPLLPGVTACVANLSADERIAIAEPLARFLAALHSIGADVAESIAAPVDEIRRLDVAYRVERVLGYVKECPEEPSLAEAADQVLAEVVGVRDGVARSIVHGDLYARHLVIGPDRELAGVIDWGDVHFGDPAVDLAIAFGFLPREGRHRFLETYGTIDHETILLSRLRALYHAAATTAYSRSVGDEDLLRESRISLRNILT